MSGFHANGPEIPYPDGSRPSTARPFVPSRREVPKYRLVLLHDPAKKLMDVIRSLMALLRFPREEATHKMWQAHHEGESILLRTHLERAELYVEQFADAGLSVTIAPA